MTFVYEVGDRVTMCFMPCCVGTVAYRRLGHAPVTGDAVNEYRIDWEIHDERHGPLPWAHEGELRRWTERLPIGGIMRPYTMPDHLGGVPGSADTRAPGSTFDPFERADPRAYAITAQDAELLSGPPQPLKILHPVTIEERSEAVRMEIAAMHLEPGDILTIVAPEGSSPNNCRDLREYTLACIPDGVSVLVLPHGSTVLRMEFTPGVSHHMDTTGSSYGDGVPKNCARCGEPIHYVDCPPGSGAGWWSHDVRPDDGHSAEGD